MNVRVRVLCSCGQSVELPDTSQGGVVKCPRCGRTYGGADPIATGAAARARPESRRQRDRSWWTYAWAALAILLLVLALLWALLLGGGGGGSGGGTGSGSADSGSGPGAGQTGQDHYAGRAREGAGGGAGDAQDAGDGGGSAAASASESNTPASRPAETLQPTENVRRETPPGSFVVDLAREDPSKLQPNAPPEPRTGSRPSASGAGGVYGARGSGGEGGNRSTARKLGATKKSEEAVEDGLNWLARVQEEDGHWDCSKWEGRHDLGGSGLAMLAFLADGQTHKEGKYQKTVSKALDWLLTQMDKDGRFKYVTFYEQGIATVALCESYGMTKDARLRRPAQKAVDFVIANMGKDGGYGYGGPGDDVHVTSFQVMAIKSAKMAGLDVPESVIARLKSYYDTALGPDGTTGYSAKAGGRGSPQSTRTAVGLFCRLFLGLTPKDAKVTKIAEVIHKAGPNVRNIFYTYNATYGMFQMGGEYWTAWNEKVRDAVIALQVKDGELRGSWDPRGWPEDGRVCTTAIYILVLEVYQRFLPMYQ